MTHPVTALKTFVIAILAARHVHARTGAWDDDTYAPARWEPCPCPKGDLEPAWLNPPTAPAAMAAPVKPCIRPAPAPQLP